MVDKVDYVWPETRLGSGNRARKLRGGANEAPRSKTTRRLGMRCARAPVASDHAVELKRGRPNHFSGDREEMQLLIPRLGFLLEPEWS